MTIKEIARTLNISDATVSRALRGNGYVSQPLKEKILSVAREGGYVPNPLAVGLRTNRSGVISYVVPYIKNPATFEQLDYLEKLASRQGITIILSATGDNIDKEARHMALLDAGLVDGSILIPCSRLREGADYITGIRKRNIVLVNRSLPQYDFDTVRADGVMTGYLALEHGVKSGCRTFAIIQSCFDNTLVRDRFEGARRAAADYGAALGEENIFSVPVSEENGARVTCRVLDMAARPDCLICLDNHFSLGALRAFRQRGVRVPEEISFISVDDVLNGDLIAPRITYVAQPISETIQLAFDMLMDLIAHRPGSGKTRNIVLPPRLVIGETCRKK